MVDTQLVIHITARCMFCDMKQIKSLICPHDVKSVHCWTILQLKLVPTFSSMDLSGKVFRSVTCGHRHGCTQIHQLLNLSTDHVSPEGLGNGFLPSRITLNAFNGLLHRLVEQATFHCFCCVSQVNLLTFYYLISNQKDYRLSGQIVL